jgi:hypothetical protein
MKTATVTIGRNIGNEPMSQTEWNNFIDQTTNALKAFETQVYGLGDTWTELHLGQGSWNGITEDSAKITLFYQEPKSSFTNDEQEAEDDLRKTLGDLAYRFEQDAVALNFGHSVLVVAKVGA